MYDTIKSAILKRDAAVLQRSALQDGQKLDNTTPGIFDPNFGFDAQDYGQYAIKPVMLGLGLRKTSGEDNTAIMDPALFLSVVSGYVATRAKVTTKTITFDSSGNCTVGAEVTSAPTHAYTPNASYPILGWQYHIQRANNDISNVEFGISDDLGLRSIQTRLDDKSANLFMYNVQKLSTKSVTTTLTATNGTPDTIVLDQTFSVDTSNVLECIINPAGQASVFTLSGNNVTVSLRPVPLTPNLKALIFGLAANDTLDFLAEIMVSGKIIE